MATRTMSYRLEGTKAVRTIETYDDDGELDSRNVIVEGERDAVLAHMEKMLAEAKNELDGVKARAPESPPPATGTPGSRVKRYFVRNNLAYEEELRYDPSGAFQSSRVRSLGIHATALEHATNRHAEILDNRDKVRDAQ